MAVEDNSNPVYKDEKYGQYRELFYSYGEKGDYEKSVGFHRDTDRMILQQAWDHFAERIASAKQQVLDGKASPLVYHMEKTLLDPMNLAMMSGIAIWRVKRHFKPGVFKRLNEKTLRKYAETMHITVEQLKVV
jgi:hypothetical protein